MSVTGSKQTSYEHDLHDIAHVWPLALSASLGCRLCTCFRDILQHLTTQFARQCTTLSVVIAQHPLRNLHPFMGHDTGALALLVRPVLLYRPLLSQIPL